MAKEIESKGVHIYRPSIKRHSVLGYYYRRVALWFLISLGEMLAIAIIIGIANGKSLAALWDIMTGWGLLLMSAFALYVALLVALFNARGLVDWVKVDYNAKWLTVCHRSVFGGNEEIRIPFNRFTWRRTYRNKMASGRFRLYSFGQREAVFCVDFGWEDDCDELAELFSEIGEPHRTFGSFKKD